MSTQYRTPRVGETFLAVNEDGPADIMTITQVLGPTDDDPEVFAVQVETPDEIIEFEIEWNHALNSWAEPGIEEWDDEDEDEPYESEAWEEDVDD